MEDDENIDCKDWFFCTKKLDKDLVLNTILKKKVLKATNANSLNELNSI